MVTFGRKVDTPWSDCDVALVLKKIEESLPTLHSYVNMSRAYYLSENPRSLVLKLITVVGKVTGDFSAIIDGEEPAVELPKSSQEDKVRFARPQCT